VVKSRSVVLSTRRKLGHGVAFYKILTLGAHSIAKKHNLSNQKQPCCTSTIVQLSVKFKRNRLPNVQDIRFFSRRPPPNVCLINLFMSSLSPAALIIRPGGFAIEFEYGIWPLIKPMILKHFTFAFDVSKFLQTF